ncbi:acyl-CoA thioesterase [Aureibaculum conchae]|uniref:acyl-CoA thioesterase n=1 Tax=Aureibaculum sp. 2308TA14-22 TaxID=3108392 RepID=UPI003395C322
MAFKIKFHTKWADFDANRHMRHTAYNDYAAECRVRFLTENGFGIERFEKDNIGPVLFKEETTFYREIKLGEDITVELFLAGMSKNGERFKMFHKIFREDGVLVAEVKIYAAWLDLEKRKLISPPTDLVEKTLNNLEKVENFEEITLKNKSEV